VEYIDEIGETLFSASTNLFAWGIFIMVNLIRKQLLSIHGAIVLRKSMETVVKSHSEDIAYDIGGKLITLKGIHIGSIDEST
jgi:hypothetical protein